MGEKVKHPGFQVTVPPSATKLVALADLKAIFGITDSASDTLLGNIVQRGSDAVDRFCNRVFAQRTVSNPACPRHLTAEAEILSSRDAHLHCARSATVFNQIFHGDVMNARTILANLDWPGLSLKIAALLVTAAFAWQALKSDVEANTKDISRLERLQGEQQKTNEKVLGGLAWLKGR